MKPGNTYLKLKLISLGYEARQIRRIENKVKTHYRHTRMAFDTPPDVWWGLNDHRRGAVRREARCSHLAYGFLRGRDYTVMERKCHTRPDWARVEMMALRFGRENGEDERSIRQRFAEWKDAATATRQ